MILSAFILGLLGSLHCVGMCGPIAFLLPLDHKKPFKKSIQLVSYHLGRLFTYALIGLLFGLLGKSFYLFGLQQRVSIIIGVLMIAAMVLPKKHNVSKWFSPFYIVVGKLKSGIGITLKKKSAFSFLTIGMLNGLLPCGLVYMAVFGAIAVANPFVGSLYMFAFGLGTVPLMTFVIYFGNYISQSVKQRILKLVPVFVIGIGILFILRGLGLEIPFVSPSELVTIKSINASHNCH